MTAIYTPKAAADEVGCSPDTIRRYVAEYGPHLSEGASPDPGKPRVLTAVDVFLLKLVKRETDRKTPAEQIHSMLESVAIPEALVAQDEEGDALLPLPTSPAPTFLDSPEAVALVRQLTATLKSNEETGRRVERVEVEVDQLRALVDNLAQVVEGKPAKPLRAIPPEYLVLMVCIFAIVALTIAGALFPP